MPAGSEAIHCRTKFEPMNPAPPVTRIRSSMLDRRHHEKCRMLILIEAAVKSHQASSGRLSRSGYPRNLTQRLTRPWVDTAASVSNVVDKPCITDAGRTTERIQFLRYTFTAENLLVRIDAKPASVDRRHRD